MINKKNKTFRVFAWLGAIVFALSLAIMPFMLKRDNLSVKADSIVTSDWTFTSSSLYLPLSFRKTSSDGFPSSIDSFCLTSFTFRTIEDLNKASLCFNGLFRYYDSSGGFYYGFNTSNTFYQFNYSSWSQLDNSILFYDTESSLVSYKLLDIWVYCDDFMGVPVGVSISFDFNSNNLISFKYFDVDNKGLTINIYIDKSHYYYGSSNTEDDFLTDFSNRTYYFSNSYDLSDNTYYQQGYSDGYTSGSSSGYSSGYSEGYDYGYSVGERSGFNSGVSSANDYTFLGLFGAIVDAPLQAFTGLFDFDISFDGVHDFNLKGFFLAILTIAIVVAIIRFALSK